MKTWSKVNVLLLGIVLLVLAAVPYATGRLVVDPVAAALSRSGRTFNRLSRWMDDLLDTADTLSAPHLSMTVAPSPLWRHQPSTSITRDTFRVEAGESENEYIIRGDLPGVMREDITISVYEGTLSITAERRSSLMPQQKQETDVPVAQEKDRGTEDDTAPKDEMMSPQAKSTQVFFSEVTYAKMTRAFKLPADADSKNVQAKLTDGVLELRIPKRELVKPRAIEIH